jgi:hypothetical protein
VTSILKHPPVASKRKIAAIITYPEVIISLLVIGMIHEHSEHDRIHQGCRQLPAFRLVALREIDTEGAGFVRVSRMMGHFIRTKLFVAVIMMQVVVVVMTSASASWSRSRDIATQDSVG